jgi:hypothetical protein
MSVKLTDREVSALATKLADKRQKGINAAFKKAAQKRLPEAKRILQQLNGLPEKVLEYLYSHRYNKGTLTATKLAEFLHGDEEGNPENTRNRDLEPEIILLAHDCNTMAQLCKKLGI